MAVPEPPGLLLVHEVPVDQLVEAGGGLLQRQPATAASSSRSKLRRTTAAATAHPGRAGRASGSAAGSPRPGCPARSAGRPSGVPARPRSRAPRRAVARRPTARAPARPARRRGGSREQLAHHPGGLPGPGGAAGPPPRGAAAASVSARPGPVPPGCSSSVRRVPTTSSGSEGSRRARCPTTSRLSSSHQCRSSSASSAGPSAASAPAGPPPPARAAGACGARRPGRRRRAWSRRGRSPGATPVGHVGVLERDIAYPRSSSSPAGQLDVLGEAPAPHSVNPSASRVLACSRRVLPMPASPDSSSRCPRPSPGSTATTRVLSVAVEPAEPPPVQRGRDESEPSTDPDESVIYPRMLPGGRFLWQLPMTARAPLPDAGGLLGEAAVVLSEGLFLVLRHGRRLGGDSAPLPGRGSMVSVSSARGCGRSNTPGAGPTGAMMRKERILLTSIDDDLCPRAKRR